MKESSNVTVEIEAFAENIAEGVVQEPPAPAAETPSEAAAADRATRLKAAQDRAAQYLREERYAEAKRALIEAEQIKAEESKAQWLAEAKAERENALLLTNEGMLAEARQALERAEKLEAKAAGRLGRPKQILASARTWIPKRSKSEKKEAADKEAIDSEPPAANPVTDSMQIVSRHSKIAAAVGLLPGGLLNFAAILPVQILMVWRIARAFDQKVGKEQIRGVLVSLLTSVIPGAIGHGAGAAIASIPAAIAGAVVYFVATPILAYALTRAVGNVFIMHFESGGTLLNFDPKAFTEYFISEFKKAGGTLRQSDESATTTNPASA
ncbi:MAG TPA: DUF697 domain-containing protein [Blastocatellia bacterium]|nr:DUF697 domain-containing protein [Blastocatellia bacterium]HMX27404.1 DUF697 domain-containing protein [Blastocatellia bacterium]HMZ19214.1 DUF697 domain-containing protein [Blastocatellia bacterium]HNG33626.1 DUF697 domain-containing protein [Blastocatellia bacterium]